MTPPPIAPVLGKVVGHLGAAGIRYMLAGSFASTIHGQARATRDVDLVIDPTQASLEAFLARLDGSVYVDRGSAREALRRRDMFNLIDLESGWKIDLIVRKDRAFSREELARCLPAVVDGVTVQVATPEDTVLSKLEWSTITRQERQLEDVRGILEVQGTALDRAYVERWARALGVSDLWARLAAERP